MTSIHSTGKRTTSQSSPQLKYSEAVRKIQRVERETLQKYLLKRAA